MAVSKIVGGVADLLNKGVEHEPRLLPLSTPPFAQPHTVGPDGATTKRGDVQLRGDYRRMQVEVQFTQRIGALKTAARTNAAAGAPPTQSYWKSEALRSAGIDPAKWNPNKGFGANAGNVQKVYQYYASLFDKHPELQWAGMAKLAGGTVLGGLQEITAVKIAAEIGGVVPGPLSPVAGLAKSDLDFLEKKLLVMQKEIFEDLAWQHEAYDKGGMAAIDDLWKNGQIEIKDYRAWQNIASGDQKRLEQGSEALLWKEQRVILPRHYAEINSHGFLGAEGRAITMAMSVMAESPIPGGRPFRDVVHRQVLGRDTGLPGNIANFADRWMWIKQDMLPKWQALNRNDPKAAHDLVVNRSLQDLANENLRKQGGDVLRFVVRTLPLPLMLR